MARWKEELDIVKVKERETERSRKEEHKNLRNLQKTNHWGISTREKRGKEAQRRVNSNKEKGYERENGGEHGKEQMKRVRKNC